MYVLGWGGEWMGGGLVRVWEGAVVLCLCVL